ncbi:MAG: hypothetical protein KJO24_05615, partial [Gammaproteobacteria bacterium]|nr:hypothetical protein [Gammaproteobacteria bacterium]
MLHYTDQIPGEFSPDCAAVRDVQEESRLILFGAKQTNYEAVLFVSRNKVLKEMLYSEFEAVLDGVVGEPEFCGETCHAVFLKIDMRLNILGMVFFIIDFDEQGGADRRWNLPLGQMLDHAPASHTLNGSAIRISCRSQCSIAAQQEYLWEPNLTDGGGVLPMLASCIKGNRLGLLVDSSVAEESAAQQDMPNAGVSAAQHATGAAYQQVVGEQAEHDAKLQKMAENLKKQQLYIASLKARGEQDIETMRSQFGREKEALLLQLEEACSTLK